MGYRSRKRYAKRAASKSSVTAADKLIWALANPDKVAQGWRLDSGGYVTRTVTIRGRRTHQREHRLVAAEMLGRKLLPGENCHHLNGDRTDNRPSNIEIWVTSQPAGQRIEDKLKWAYELIALHDPDGKLRPVGE